MADTDKTYIVVWPGTDGRDYVTRFSTHRAAEAFARAMRENVAASQSYLPMVFHRVHLEEEVR